MLQTLFPLAALAALLLAPGPSNALLAASAAAVGVRHSLLLLPVMILGYALGIAGLHYGLGPVAARHPAVATVMNLIAIAILLNASAQLWLRGGQDAAAAHMVTPRQIFFVTLFNPKCVIFAFQLLPALPGGLGLPLFAAMALMCGSLWLCMAQWVARTAGDRVTPLRIARSLAVVQMLFVGILASATLGRFV